MGRQLRISAAAATVLVAAALATPGIDSASASGTTPSLPALTGALSAAGVSSSQINTITSELQSLQGVTPGGSLPALSLSSLDSSLTTLNGGLVSHLGTPVTTLLATLNPAAPTSISDTLADLQQIGSASGASTSVTQAVSELSSSVTTAGLNQLFSQLSSLSPTQITSAVSALGNLQSLSLGSAAGAGSLAPVATVETALAEHSGVPSSVATTLENDAATLGGSGTISPAALLGVIGDLQMSTSSLPSPLNGTASALAAQLADSGSILGGLSSTGDPVSSSTISTALDELSALPGTSAGASLPAGQLGTLGGVLQTIAAEPGVPSGAASALTEAASTLEGSSAIDPTELSGVIGSLQGASSSLPSPLNTTVGGIASSLATAGSLAPGGSTGTTGSTGSTGSTGTTSPTGSTGTGGDSTSGLTPAELAYFNALYKEIALLESQLGKASTHAGYASIEKVSEHGRTLTVTLGCGASSNRSCTTTVSALRSRHTIAKHVRIKGGATDRVRMTLTRAQRSGATVVTAKTGAFSTSKRIR
jgi:hypothetical protein